MGKGQAAGLALAADISLGQRLEWRVGPHQQILGDDASSETGVKSLNVS
jgi:hypothetical protein